MAESTGPTIPTIPGSLPKLGNTEICHAVLPDGSRCKNKVEKRRIDGKMKSSKWCSQHNRTCKEKYETYKDSCLNFRSFPCSKDGTRSTESSKQYAIKRCYNDRKDFEEKCYHESLRDEGHKKFLDFLSRMFEECTEIIQQFPVQKSIKKQTDITTERSEELISDVMNSLNILSIEERKRLQQQKQELQRKQQMEREQEEKRLSQQRKLESRTKTKQQKQDNEIYLFESVISQSTQDLIDKINEKFNKMNEDMELLRKNRLDFQELYVYFNYLKKDKIFERLERKYKNITELVKEIYNESFQFENYEDKSELTDKEQNTLINLNQKLDQYHFLIASFDQELKDYKINVLDKKLTEFTNATLSSEKRASEDSKNVFIKVLKNAKKDGQLTEDTLKKGMAFTEKLYDSWLKLWDETKDVLDRYAARKITVDEFMKKFSDYGKLTKSMVPIMTDYLFKALGIKVDVLAL